MRPVSSRTANPEHTQVEGEPLMTAESIGDARDVLADFPGLADVAVIEHGPGDDDRCLIGYVVPSAPGLDMGELQAFAGKSLPVPELSGLLPCHPPVTPRQERLREIFAEVLGVARCGVSSDFFDLGGRSVEAMLLARRISTRLPTRGISYVGNGGNDRILARS